MNNLVPVEFKNKRILTTKQLAEIYECNETQITQNFNNHLDKFTMNKHYHLLQGEELKKFKRDIDIIDVASNVNKLYLWTERGANRHCKILDTDKAWEQFDSLEENYFNPKENKPTCIEDVLIQSLQEMKALKQEVVQAKRIGNEAKAEATEAKEKVQAIKDVITISPNAWRSEVSNILNKIAIERGGTSEAYKQIREESYKLLDERAGAKLNIRLTNRKRKVLEETGSKSKADKVSKLDIIADDKKLTEVYLAIVKDMAIKYEVA